MNSKLWAAASFKLQAARKGSGNSKNKLKSKVTELLSALVGGFSMV